MDDERIVRIPLPVEMVRRVDRLILSGVGGFTTRTDFFREGAQLLLDEYTHSGGPGGRTYEDLAPEVGMGTPTEDIALDGTILRAPIHQGVVVADGAGSVRQQMLFGLHNRDYPSLWALRQIAELTTSTLRDLDECLRLVTAEAWRYGEKLTALEGKIGRKLTALFPTNYEKRQSADDAFRNFAIGGCATTGNGLVATGPLFEWRACGLALDADAKVVIGMTDSGNALLRDMDGLSLRLPHDRGHADAFFKHLRQYDASDWRGFEFVVKVVASEVTRDELVEAFSGTLDQRQDQAATYAAGYIARAREWGLVEPKQRKGRYALTPFGEELAGAATGVTA